MLWRRLGISLAEQYYTYTRSGSLSLKILFSCRPTHRTAHAQKWRISAIAQCNGLRFTNRCLFCSFFMTFSRNYGSIFVETTWPIYREECFSEFKWNCYLTTKNFTLTEMTMEPFSRYGREPT